MPSWSAWMIARTNDESSGAATRCSIFFSASARPSPTRISPSMRANSLLSGPSMCSVIFVIEASKPSPASTETARRSSASGSAERMVSRRARPRDETMNSGATQPSAVRVSPSRTAAPAPPTLAPKMSPRTNPPAALQPLMARNVVVDIEMPAESSLSVTASAVVFGDSRSTVCATRPASGSMARSRKERVSPRRSTSLP